MGASTITNFIEPTKDIVSWVIGKLEGYTYWGVHKYQKLNYDEIFKYVIELRCPAAVVVYTGSQYDDQIQRRDGTFVVIVIEKDMTDSDAGAIDAQDLLDKAISLLDHEVYNDMFCKVKYDKLIDFPNTGLVAYEVGFVFKDH